MSPQIVVAFRMPLEGVTFGSDGPYLARARALCARGEALGGRLIAWSASALAVAWDTDSIEEAILLAVGIGDEDVLPERAWACGIAEGELTPLAPDGQRMHLAWGSALVSAVALARVAEAGEAIVDGEVAALRRGQLALLGPRTAEDEGRPVRGWRLELERPWIRTAAESPADATDRHAAVSIHDVGGTAPAPDAFAAPPPDLALDPTRDLNTIPAGPDLDERPSAVPRPPSDDRSLIGRLRALVGGQPTVDALHVLAQARLARESSEGAAPGKRCQAALGLSAALFLAGRPEEALLEALDALARAREAGDAHAVQAAIALLAQLYTAAGFPDAAAMLREVTVASELGPALST